MNIKKSDKEEFIMIGVAALRDPVTREILPAVPLYIRRTPETTASEQENMQDVAKLFAGKFREYAEGVRAEEKKRAAAEKKAKREAE